MFQVNQKVVCINNGPSRFGRRAMPKLRKGGIYTITECFYHQVNKVDAVLLAEVEPNLGYSAFDAARFKPITHRTTDISVFKKLLNPKLQDA